MTINNDQASFYFTKEKHHRKSRQTKILTTRALFVIVQFTVACLVAKPLIRSEAKVDLVMIQTLLLFKCKLPCCYANQVLVLQQGHLQPHSKSKAWQPSTQL